MHSQLFFLALAISVSAKTDLSGCTTSNVIAFGGASVLWYEPGSGEICSFLDCGGGMAPPKTTVPGCPEYSGTATYSPSFLPGFEDGAATVSSTALATATVSPSSAMITGAATSEGQSSILSFINGQYTLVSPSSPSETTLTGTVTSSSEVSTDTKSPTTTKPPSVSTSVSSTSSASSSSSTGNAGTANSVDVLIQGVVGAAAAGFALL